MGERYCRYCGEPLPENARRNRVYCKEKCRRAYQRVRRKAERAEAREARQAGKSMSDPWGRSGLDDWTAEDILANALIDCPSS